MRHGIAAVAVVFDDGAYGNVRRSQELRYGNRLIGCDLANPDFVELAKSFGMGGTRVTNARGIDRGAHRGDQGGPAPPYPRAGRTDAGPVEIRASASRARVKCSNAAHNDHAIPY